jgi:hypothetical protein
MRTGRQAAMAVAGLILLLASWGGVTSAQGFESCPHRLEVPPDIRAYYSNPDGSCVQCSIGMCGIWSDEPKAYTLLWNTQYGPAVRGGSWAGRVETYARQRQMSIYNVTGSSTFEWMEWCCRTGRFAAIGAGTSHFQTLAGFDPTSRTWYVCNNNSPTKIDTYSDSQFRRLHLASGPWIVVLDDVPPPMCPRYLPWWQ